MLFYLTFLKQIGCLFLEIEGVREPLDSQISLKTEILPMEYYWFEWKNRIYIFRFDNTLRFHENPFVIIILVDKMNDETWFDLENYRLLETAFDNFQKNSGFFSLLPHKPNNNFYDFFFRLKTILST